MIEVSLFALNVVYPLKYASSFAVSPLHCSVYLVVAAVTIAWPERLVTEVISEVIGKLTLNSVRLEDVGSICITPETSAGSNAQTPDKMLAAIFIGAILCTVF